jgi:hypothetical protein
VGALVGVSLLSFLFSYFLRLSQPVRTNLVKSGGLFELLFTLLYVYVIVIYVISPVGYLSRMSIAAFQVSTRVVPNYSRSTTSVPCNLWNYSRTTPLYPSPAP